MWFLLNKYFTHQLEDYDLDVTYVKYLLDNVAKGRSIFLGHKLYKVRASRKGQGKSGGFRNIFFWKKEEFIIFCYLFPKSKRVDISDKEFRALCILADEYDRLTKKEITQMLAQKDLVEVMDD